MINRRDLLQAGIGLPVVAGLTGTGEALAAVQVKADDPASRSPDQAGRDPKSGLAGSLEERRRRSEAGSSVPRLLTGVAQLDAVTSGIAIGGVTCLAGRTCMGKTSLALQVALSVCESHRCNVLMVSAREPARTVAARLRRCTSVHAAVVGDAWLHRWALHRSRANEPAVYLIDASRSAETANAFAESLTQWDNGNVGLLILDGYGSVTGPLARRSLPTETGIAYRPVNFYDQPALITVGSLRGFKERSDKFNIPHLLTLRTAGIGEERVEEPQASDLWHLEAPVAEFVDQVVWMHRPHVYNKNLPGDPFAVQLSSKMPFVVETEWKLTRRT